MQNVINAAAQLVLSKRKLDHITADIEDQLHWRLNEQRVKYQCTRCAVSYTSTCLHELPLTPTYDVEMCV